MQETHKGRTGPSSHTNPASSSSNQQTSQKNAATRNLPRQATDTLGTWVKLTTVTGTTLEGQIYAFDETTGCIVLQSPHRPANAISFVANKFDIHVIKLSFVQEVQVLQPKPSRSATTAPNKGTTSSSNTQNSVPDFKDSDTSYEALTTRQVSTTSTLVPLGHVMTDKLQQKEQAAVKAEQEKAERLKSGISKDGILLFDALKKTMQCKWKGTSIAVMDEVIIAAPYTPDKCSLMPTKSGDGPERLLARVKKVVEGERRRLGL